MKPSKSPARKSVKKKATKKSPKRRSAAEESGYGSLLYFAAVVAIVGALFYVGYSLMAVLLLLILVAAGFGYMYPEAFALWSGDIQAKFGAKEEEPYHPLAGIFSTL